MLGMDSANERFSLAEPLPRLIPALGSVENDISYTDGLMQERRNSIANTLELRLSCTNPSI